MTRSDDVINEDGHDVIAAHTRVVRGMAAALAAIAATGAGVTAAAANVMFTFALDTKAKRSMFNMPHEETRKWPNGRIAMRNSVLRSCYPRSAPMS